MLHTHTLNLSIIIILICKILCSHSGGYEQFYLLGYYAVQFVEINRRLNMSHPSSGPENKQA
jgi:hypothetical protein